MEIDESGWHDVDIRLAASQHDEADLKMLIDHVSDRLVSHFGVDVIEIWLGKDGIRRHSIREVAAAAVAHLAPVIDAVDGETIARLRDSGAIGSEVPPPWDDHWRSDPRTASWRS